MISSNGIYILLEFIVILKVFAKKLIAPAWGKKFFAYS